jgi:hypothetical protein
MAELGRIPPGGGPEGVDISAYEERIAQLERVIAEKEEAVLRAVVSANEVGQQLQASQAETRALKAQLDLVRDRPTSAAMGDAVSRMSAQFELARKSLDRERAQSQAEAAAVNARLRQAKGDLDHERQMRQADNAAHSARIASLQRELTGAQAQASPTLADSPRSIWARLAGGALVGALLVCAYVGWMRFSIVTGTSTTPPATGSKASREPARSIRRSSEQPTAGWSKEKEGESLDPSVCDFPWIGGLPTILYSGRHSLVAILSRCTQADETARAQ